MSIDPAAVNYAVAERDLKYYIFDWDDNVLHMPTRIHLERRTGARDWVSHSVSTSVFSIIRKDTARYRPMHGDWEEAFRDFRDITVKNENVFLRDTREAIDRVARGDTEPAPSFEKLRRTLIEGRLFSILTARGHDPEIIKAGVRYFIEKLLNGREKAEMLRNLRGYLACFEPGHGIESDSNVLEYYLSLCRYYGVMSPHFRELLRQHDAEAADTEEGKQFAIRDFLAYVLAILRRCGVNRPVSIGFSDDDVHNVQAVEAFIRTALAREFPNVKFVVYHTADPELPTGRKIEVRGQLNLPLA